MLGQLHPVQWNFNEDLHQREEKGFFLKSQLDNFPKKKRSTKKHGRAAPRNRGGCFFEEPERRATFDLLAESGHTRQVPQAVAPSIEDDCFKRVAECQERSALKLKLK